ncbi:divalent-cation tolerance protein CutA [Candidatus Gottesmanbacteria bacterium]|nr:divalent-cation tolerance protein CutA [Candidatus Gottesmanbacteria bacterium]
MNIIVYVPCKDKAEAKKIARDLVKNKLAACTNIIPTVVSIYRWKGKMEEATESILISKTASNLVDRVISQIKKLHSYEMPEIISWKIDKTTKEISQWLTNELK